MCKQGCNNKDLSVAIGQRFAEELDRLDLSVNEIARRMGNQHPQRVRDVLSGKTRVPTDMLALAVGLGVDVNYIITGQMIPVLTKEESTFLDNYRSSSKQNKDHLRGG